MSVLLVQCHVTWAWWVNPYLRVMVLAVRLGFRVNIERVLDRVMKGATVTTVSAKSV